jgi:hypothetical protein
MPKLFDVDWPLAYPMLGWIPKAAFWLNSCSAFFEEQIMGKRSSYNSFCHVWYARCAKNITTDSSIDLPQPAKFMDPYQDASQHGYGQYGMPQTPDGMGGSGNRSLQNVAQACQYCKSRHSKCDGLHPCSTCVRRGRESECSYSAVKKRGPKPKKDLYEYCNKLLVELEVQKQIADYWKGMPSLVIRRI